MITVISPLYNEELIIKQTVESMLAKLSQLEEEWEYIVVNDGSTDNSLNILQEIAKQNPRLKIISYKKNRGRGYALRQGFKNAKGDIIITTEADSSWGENIVFEFLEKFKQDDSLDVIVASPHIKDGGYKNVPLYRVLLSKWGNIILKWAVEGRLTMLSGMCRAYKRHVIDSLILENDGKEIHLEIISKVLALGYNIGEIPAILEWKNIELKNSKKTKKRKSSFNAKKLILSHLMFSFYESPVLLLGTIGILFVFVGLGIGIYLLILYFYNLLTPVRPLFYLMLAMFNAGGLMILFCFLAYQNKRTQTEIYKIQAQINSLKKERN